MKSPQDMRIIQIDITNACIFQCSNCTRFCGHHKKPFFMDYETFKQAVDSLDGYVGTIGMMGGEPTLNPDFEKMAEYLASKKPMMKTDKMLRPQRHFMDGIHDLEFEHTFLHPMTDGEGKRQTVDGPGLWATTKANYKKYYETIQDTVQYQALNDHSRPMYHQPALISRKALGISDIDWIPMRDSCWVQNEWSASITPKGAFFCEVAACLDMLFDGSGGWKVEPGWWKRTPDEFGDQIHWCELCGLACKTYMRNANEQVYDVSMDIYEKLEKAGSRLFGTDKINVVEIVDGIISEESKAEGKRFGGSMPYTESYSARFNEEKSSLSKKQIIGIICCDRYECTDYAAESAGIFETSHILCPDEMREEIHNRIQDNKMRGKEYGNVSYFSTSTMNLGELLFEVNAEGNTEKYLMVVENNIRIKKAYDDMMSLVLNPGTLLYSEYNNYFSDDYFQVTGEGKAALFCGWAKSYRTLTGDKIKNIKSIVELPSLWQKKKVFPFSPDTVYTAPSITIKRDGRYVIYGAGVGLRAAIDSITSGGAKIITVIDSNSEIHGDVRCNYVVEDPQEVLSHRERFDHVMIASGVYYREIKGILLENGITEEMMAWV